MAENNKILDVTYGGFSCRLEGFDDAVETMKSVVGYFHELAGQSIFTSDAPALPDLDVIARLAAEQADGPVTIETVENGISLRVTRSEVTSYAPEASEYDDATMEDTLDEEPSDFDDDEVEMAPYNASAFAMQEEVAEDVVVSDDDQDVEETIAPDAASETAIADPVAPENFEASVAEKLKRIRAVVGRGGPQTPAPANAEVPNESAPISPSKSVNPLAQRLAELAKRNSELMQADAMLQTPAAAESAPLPLGEDELADESAYEDNAEDVKVVPEVLRMRHDELAAEEELSEADVAQESDADEDETVANEIADEPMFDAEVALSDTQDDDEADADTDETVLEADEADAEVAGDDEDDVVEEAAELEEEAEVEAAADEHDAADRDEDEDEEDEDEDEEDDVELAKAGSAEDDVEEDEDDDAVSADALAAKRNERDDKPLLLTTRYQLNPDDEADEDEDGFDLQEEVAKIEREIASRPGNEVARHGLPRSVEDAMSRIMTKTNLQLDLQETRDGRDAIAQLKAAVAATEAARQLGDTGMKSRDVSAMFRDDLGALEGTENSDGTALPPLKLVKPIDETPSSLREVAPLTDAAARLRGIAELSKARSAETKVLTFADFAEQHGATDLVDKLEAAAAYLAFVEGEADFSRPQVMKVVQSATLEEVTREDGLRCFGRLLRQSRIVKLNNGRFQIPTNSRFRPSGNKAAQG